MIKPDEILEQLTPDNVIKIMSDLGSPLYGRKKSSDGNESLEFRTICHGGDSHKLIWYTNTKTFQCYTCCGTLSIFELVKRIKEYRKEDFGQLIRYLCDQMDIKQDSKRRIGIVTKEEKEAKEYIELLKHREEINNSDYSVKDITNFYDDRVLRLFDPDSFYLGWEEEGITEESMRKYNIRYYWLEDHIIIPHYNIDGKLVGIRRRSLNPQDAKNKYMPEKIGDTFYEHPLGLNLYGLDHTKDMIQKSKMAIIAEGEKSVLLSDSYYGDNSVAVATCGFNVSNWQIMALKKLDVEKVFISFDKDFDITKEEDYKKDKLVWENYLWYKKKLNNIAKKLNEYFNVYIIFDKLGLLQIKDSPFDRGKEVFDTLIRHATRIRPIYEL